MVFIKYALIGHVNKALDKVEISTYKRRLLLILLISAFIESIFIVFRKLYWFSMYIQYANVCSCQIQIESFLQ